MILKNIKTLTFSFFILSLAYGPKLTFADELSIFDINIPATSSFTVAKNNRSMKAVTITPKRNEKVHVNIIEDRNGMWLISISKNNKKIPGNYLISKKWAEISLNVNAVLQTEQLNLIAQTATIAPGTSDKDCIITVDEVDPDVEVEEAEVDNSDLANASIVDPVTIFDIDILATSDFTVAKNNASMDQLTISPKKNENVVVKVLQDRGAMWLISIERNGKKVPGEFLISKKWGEKSLNLNAALEAAQVSDLVELATNPPVIEVEEVVEVEEVIVRKPITLELDSKTPIVVPEPIVVKPTPIDPSGAVTKAIRPVMRPKNFKGLDRSLRPRMRPKNLITVSPTDRAQGVSEDYKSTGICDNFSTYADTFKKHGANVDALKQAFRYFQLNGDNFPNKIITVADYSLNSVKPRFFKIDLSTKTIIPPKQVSHGSGNINGGNQGDPNHLGNIKTCYHAEGFRNARTETGRLYTRQNMTRPGFFRTKHLYMSTVCNLGGKKSTCKKRGGRFVPRPNWPLFNGGQHNGLKLEGLSQGINDDAMQTGVVMHEAFYNTPGKKMGRSWGCPAFTPKQGRGIMNSIKGGSLYYSYVPACGPDMKDIEKDVPNWKNTCVNSSPPIVSKDQGKDAGSEDDIILDDGSDLVGKEWPATPGKDVAPYPEVDAILEEEPIVIEEAIVLEPTEPTVREPTREVAGIEISNYIPKMSWGGREIKKDQSFKCMDYNQLLNIDANLTPEEKLEKIYKNGRIVVHHSAGQRVTNPSGIQAIQNSHIDGAKKLQDVAYHFLIDQNGSVYEGRSLEVMGAHAGALPRSHYQCDGVMKNQDVSKDYDYKAIGIMLTGDFESVKGAGSTDVPTDAQYSALRSLVLKLQAKYNITKISPHRHVNNTDCPGQALVDKILSDPRGFRFSPDPQGVNTDYPSVKCSAPSTSCGYKP